MENLSYLFFAYSIIWIALFGYLYHLSKKVRDLKRGIQGIKEGLDNKNP